MEAAGPARAVPLQRRRSVTLRPGRCRCGGAARRRLGERPLEAFYTDHRLCSDLECGMGRTHGRRRRSVALSPHGTEPPPFSVAQLRCSPRLGLEARPSSSAA